MAEYIERELLIEVLRKSHSYHARTSRDSSLLGRDIRLVKEQPAADVVEVVRCKDCIHWYDREETCLKIYSDGAVSPYAWQFRKPDDFCSYGERKDDT